MQYKNLYLGTEHYPGRRPESLKQILPNGCAPRFVHCQQIRINEPWQHDFNWLEGMYSATTPSAVFLIR